MNTRQYRLLGLCAVLGLLVLYYLSNGARNTRQSAFYVNTVSVLTRKQGSSGGAAGPKIDLDSPEEKLKIENYKKAMRDLALQFDPAGEDGARADVYQALLSKQATETATDAAGLPTPAAVAPGAAADEPAFPELQPSDQEADTENPLKVPLIPEDKSIGGRKKSSDGKVVPNRPDTGDEKADASTGSDVENSVEAELNEILAKRGPVVVFSKTMCPYSKKAKHILQDFYTIVPAPYVVEIDQHPHGPELQAALETLTGRRTVPNVFIGGKSIGGGDDVEALHMKSKLMDKVRELGGKRLTSVATKMAAMVPNPGKQK